MKLNIIKKLAIIILVIIVIVSIAGIIKFNILNDDIYIQNEDGTVEKYDKTKHGEKAYRSKVMLKLFSIKTSNDLIINVPETEATSKITDFISIDLIEMAKGVYSDGVEKGIVFLDYIKISTVIVSKSNDQIYFVAPFLVSNQGSGVFYYLGLFVQNVNELSINHIDSYFIGDRIKISSIDSDQDEIQIKLKVHSIKQSMAEEPDENKNIKIKVTEKGFGKD